MSVEKLEPGDRVKIFDDWSKRGTLVGLMTENVDELNEVRTAFVQFDNEREPRAVPLSKLVHISYTWSGEWVPL